MGVKFRVGSLYSLNLTSPQPEMDRIISVDLNEFFQSESFHAANLLAKSTNDPQQASDMLDGLLLPWLLDSHEDKHSELVRRAVLLLPDTPIAQMGTVLHCSKRTIERSFLRVTNPTLKQ